MCVVPTGLQRWSADRSLAVVGVIRPGVRAARRPLVLVCGGPCARAPERRLEAVDAVCSGASATRRPHVLVCRGPPAESVRVALRGESALSVLAALMAQAPNPGPWGEAGDPECRRAGGLDGPARRALGAAAGSLFRGWVRFALLLEEILSRSRGISALAFPLPSARFRGAGPTGQRLRLPGARHPPSSPPLFSSGERCFSCISRGSCISRRIMRDIQSIHLRRSQAVVFHKVKLAASRVEDRDHLWPAGHHDVSNAGHQCLHPGHQ